MKTGSVSLIFLRNYSQLPLCNISWFAELFTADVDFFFCCFLVRICVVVDVDDIISIPPPLLQENLLKAKLLGFQTGNSNTLNQGDKTKILSYVSWFFSKC